MQLLVVLLFIAIVAAGAELPKCEFLQTTQYPFT